METLIRLVDPDTLEDVPAHTRLECDATVDGSHTEMIRYDEHRAIGPSSDLGHHRPPVGLWTRGAERSVWTAGGPQPAVSREAPEPRVPSSRTAQWASCSPMPTER